MTTDPTNINNPPVSPAKPTVSVGPEGSSSNLDLNQESAQNFNLGSGQSSSSGLKEAPSPMDLAQSGNATQTTSQQITPESLQKQAQSIDKNFSDVHTKLNDHYQNNPNASFKSQWGDLINQHMNKALDAQNYVANQLGGVNDLKPPSAPLSVLNFLNYLTGSQDQMQKIGSSLASMPPGELTPGKLLAIQQKMNTVNLQINYFTTILGKAGDDFKTIMNTQS